MNGPTWADVGSRHKLIERREVGCGLDTFMCPFCSTPGPIRLLKKETGHRCDCGALFYAQQAVAVHFKERE
jgi:hypothetical protein